MLIVGQYMSKFQRHAVYIGVSLIMCTSIPEPSPLYPSLLPDKGNDVYRSSEFWTMSNHQNEKPIYGKAG
jgi:hypothetical protein